MKAKNFLFVSLLFFLLIISCDKKAPNTIAETSNMVFESTSSASGIQDPNKKFIHTANINIEVKDALKSTLIIEKNVVNLGGYVGKSELKSNVISRKTTPISKDSARETKVYSVTNFMEVRIPKYNLNEFLLSLNQEIGFLTSRNLEIIDATTEAQILNIKNLQKKTNQKEKILKKNELVRKNELDDQLKYATVTLALFEKENIKHSIITNTEDYKAYENSNFGYKLQKALYTGNYILQWIITTLLYIWPLWILLMIGYVFYKKYKKRLR